MKSKINDSPHPVRSLNLMRAARLGLISILIPAVLGQVTAAQAEPIPDYLNAQKPLEIRLNDLMGRLTLEEKISLLGGTRDMLTHPILPRLHIPSMEMVDGGQGVRGGAATGTMQGPATAFPAAVMMASTWNPALVGQVAAAIGVETQNKGTGAQMLLGPAVNIHRSPLGGRNGEYFSEDPFLSARLSVAYIRAMQATGALACIKHFAANNQETERGGVNAVVSERALREIYWPSFEAGVREGRVAAVMTAYNRLNGPHCSASHYLITDVLKRGWNFDGVVMSDWGGVHETARTINAGNDLEMPGPTFLSQDKVKDALDRGLVTTEQIDQNVRRILRTVFRSGVVDGVRPPNHALVNSDAHREVALKAAQEGIVLLKNKGGLLPLNPNTIRSIALIGPAAEHFQVTAAGSPEVQPLHEVGPLEGIRTRLSPNVIVRSTPGTLRGAYFAAGTVTVPGSAEAGFKAEYFANKNLEGAPLLTRTDAQINLATAPSGLGPDNWSTRWTTTLTPRRSGHTKFYLRADDGSRLFINGNRLIDHWQDSAADVQTATINLTAGQRYELRVEYFQTGGNMAVQLGWDEPGAQPYNEVSDFARRSDMAVVFVTTRGDESEGHDRTSMDLPENQNELIRQVVAANPKTIVVLNNGTPVSMPWLGSVPALLETWFPGQEGGRALAQILFGDINPSGHLPTTLGARREDYPDYPNFPGTNGIVRYEEGIYVGYRAFDKRNIAPLFPFGHGLSYTTFRIDNLRLSAPTLAANGTLTASVRVTNTGRRAGAQVVQLYIHDPNPQIDKPVRELKGFAKVMLQPGQSQVVTLTLKPRDFAWCDVDARGWRVNAGNYQIEVGDSSRNIPQHVTVQVAASLEPIPFMRDEAALRAAVAGPDIARGKAVTASSTEGPQYKPEGAVDGDPLTRWSSTFADNQWLTVDLGRPERIGRVHLAWEDAYAMSYRIEVSSDGQNWTPVYTTDRSKGDGEDIGFTPVEARYVRLFAVKRATNNGNSLYSFEVRAPLKKR
jgi:beta-glucosidase